jgi:predicted PurR-regulated permease PerM
MAETARRAFVTTLVALAVIVGALALWKVKIVLALVFLGLILAAAMRPGIDWLAERKVPRPLGVALHYLVIAAALALMLWLVVPRAIDQVDQALGGVPTSQQELQQKAKHSTGIKHQFFVGLQKRLAKLPSAGSVVHGAVSVGTKAIEVLVGIFFVFATAAYWIFERERTIGLVTSMMARKHRKTVHDTWELIDAKLGAFVRGQLLLVTFVATVLSLSFWAIGMPFWLLLGVFAGLVEVIPVIGPLLAGAVAVGVGLTVSWHLGLFAGIVVLVVRQFEDYVVIPRVMGHVTGLSPLLVLVSVSCVGLLLGPFYVLIATPVVATIVTLLDVIVRDKDPAEEEVPTVLFPKESAGS